MSESGMNASDPVGPIFVVGFPRSGTSLLRDLLSSHPDIGMLPFETHLLNQWLPKYGHGPLGSERFHEFWTEFTGHQRFKLASPDSSNATRYLASFADATIRDVFEALLKAHASIGGKALVGEKTPDHYKRVDLLLDWFPTSRVVFMVRDPRAVLASWNVLDRVWTDRPDTTILFNWLASVYELDRWKSNRRVLKLRYEDLVADPEAVLGGVFRFVGVENTRKLLRRDSHINRHGQYDTRGPIEVGSVDRWREVLNGEQVELAESIAGATMVRNGYSTRRPVTAIERAISYARKAVYLIKRYTRPFRQRL